MSKFKYEGAGWYKMRNGEKVWVGCDLREGGCEESRTRSLVGLVEGKMTLWPASGVYFADGEEGDYDLISKLVEPRKVTFWVNFYSVKDTESIVSGGVTFSSKGAADRNATGRIACKEFTWVEGEE